MTRPPIIQDALDKEPGPFFQGLPERWLDSPHYRCEEGHISTRYLKSERLGRSACLACGGALWLTFPEDKENPEKES